MIYWLSIGQKKRVENVPSEHLVGSNFELRIRVP